jgi:hypothetical protein
LHFGHSITAGLAKSVTDIFMLQLGHATIFAPAAFTAGCGLPAGECGD